jgi:hypothetical protein
VRLDIKHLPKLQTANGERRKRYLYVAIDRCSRWVYLAVKDKELTGSAITFLTQAIHAAPSRSGTCTPTAAHALRLTASRQPAAN